MDSYHHGNRGKFGLVAVMAVVVGLLGATGANAAPRDNFVNAAKCLRGGWHLQVKSNGDQFAGPVACLLYALRGNAFGTGRNRNGTERNGTGTEPEREPERERNGNRNGNRNGTGTGE